MTHLISIVSAESDEQNLKARLLSLGVGVSFCDQLGGFCTYESPEFRYKASISYDCWALAYPLSHQRSVSGVATLGGFATN